MGEAHPYTSLQHMTQGHPVVTEKKEKRLKTKRMGTCQRAMEAN